MLTTKQKTSIASAALETLDREIIEDEYYLDVMEAALEAYKATGDEDLQDTLETRAGNLALALIYENGSHIPVQHAARVLKIVINTYKTLARNQ